MRTTIDIPDDLFRQAKARAAMEGVPLRNLIEDGLRLKLTAPNARVRYTKENFPVFRAKKKGEKITFEMVKKAMEEEQMDEDIRKAQPL